MRAIIAFVLALGSGFAVAVDSVLTGPATAPMGSVVEIGWNGSVAAQDFISIDAVGAPERQYGPYAYPASGLPVNVTVPEVPGPYVIRYHLAADYAVVASLPIEVTAVTATLTVAPEVEAGGTLSVQWQGPNQKGDFISIDPVGAPDRQYGPYAYPSSGNPLTIRAPDEAGPYEVRYHLGGSYAVIGQVPTVVGGTQATLSAVDEIIAGGKLAVQWDGPAHAQDFISIDAVGAPDRQYGPYAYPATGNPVDLRVPDEPGDYVIRYHTGQTYAVRGSRPLKVLPVTATLTAPGEVVAGRVFEVTWEGPNNERDFITLVPVATPENRWGNSNGYTMRGNPVRIQADVEPGAYELRYLTGQSYHMLAKVPITITADSTSGTLRVLAAPNQATPAFDAIELVLDASGSMLARVDGKRRVDIAKRALSQMLVDIPPSTRLAMRVFGTREADSCRTDLELPLAPFDAAAVQARIDAIEPKNLARTPIGASLLEVKNDLAGVTGASLVLLVTDGEETCDGDPAAAISGLRAAGLDVRVNIVGFAIDEVGLKETFATWARAGNGSYFDARGGDELAAAMRAALGATFEAVDGMTVVAAGALGTTVAVPPGSYTVRVPGSDRQVHAKVAAGALTEVSL